jgi:hypothetical protein
MKRPKQEPYAYIQRAYGNYGLITKEDQSNGHYVQVRFEGRNFSVPCHPDELEYNVMDHRVAHVA